MNFSKVPLVNLAPHASQEILSLLTRNERLLPLTVACTAKVGAKVPDPMFNILDLGTLAQRFRSKSSAELEQFQVRMSSA
jgi:hypothetical protein